MADAKYRNILTSGVENWNEWRKKNYDPRPDLTTINLSGADLHRANLSGADLHRANLSGADLSNANLEDANLVYTNLYDANLSNVNLLRANLSLTILYKADLHRATLQEANLDRANLSNANLSKANLSFASLRWSNLSYANLSGADLSNTDLFCSFLILTDLSDAKLYSANLSYANLSGANLSNANLNRVILVEAELTNTTIEGAKIYGISAWDINKDGLIQKDLVITKIGEPEITVDNLEMAQFIYLMLNNQNIRDVIDTLTSKTVLILGRFSNARKPLLDAIKDELRKRNYLPILFDFEKPANRDLTETISILARMSRFVIADLTDAKSIPQELSHFVPDTFLPVVPIILQEQREYGMFEHFKRYDWVLPIYQYETPEAMLSSILENVIEPAERKVVELRERGK